mmetsp:Transcript_3802/g.8690  ORF Transcript_3802/g.8690 Transcript_3802/m.8690 type:complete len:249 (+) Transcript_3802:565-1311(+)
MSCGSSSSPTASSRRPRSHPRGCPSARRPSRTSRRDTTPSHASWSRSSTTGGGTSCTGCRPLRGPPQRRSSTLNSGTTPSSNADTTRLMIGSVGCCWVSGSRPTTRSSRMRRTSSTKSKHSRSKSRPRRTDRNRVRRRIRRRSASSSQRRRKTTHKYKLVLCRRGSVPVCIRRPRPCRPSSCHPSRKTRCRPYSTTSASRTSESPRAASLCHGWPHSKPCRHSVRCVPMQPRCSTWRDTSTRERRSER